MNQAISETEIKELFDECGGNISEVASRLGVDPSRIVSVTVPHTVSTKPLEVPENLGKSALRRYKVSVRHQSQTSWPVADKEAILRARKLYDQGTHEMCQQKTKDGWYILYLIPRKKQDYLRMTTPWFQIVEEGGDQ